MQVGPEIHKKNTSDAPNPSGESTCCADADPGIKNPIGPIAWFRDMVPNALRYARSEKAKGRPIVGILCEYTPREVILAAGAIPVCLCGGSAAMIPAAEETLPVNLCPLVKSTFGYSVQKMNPFLEMADLVVAETTCDGKKKMYELLERRHPMTVLELPQKPKDPDALAHWIREVRKLKSVLETRFDEEITGDSLAGAIRMMNRERKLRRRLSDLMQSDKPPLTGRELLDFKSLISCIPADLEQYGRALETLPGRTLDPPAESRVRVLLTGVPLPHGAERVMEIIEDNGGLVVIQENCTGQKPILEDVAENTNDPLEAIAKKYFHLPCSVMTKNEDRFQSIKDLSIRFSPQCVVDLVWQDCLTYDVESVWIRKLAEEELGLPFLQIQTDYSPSDSARITMRVQALYETVRERSA